MSNKKIRVGITHGDFNGIGYEVLLKALAEPHILEICTPVVYGSPKIANFYRKQLGVQSPSWAQLSRAEQARDGEVGVINVCPDEVKIEPGVSSQAAGEAAFAALERAVTDLRAGDIDVLVTAPINKKNIQSPTFSFSGHTEYLEASLHNEGDADHALMILFNDVLRVALVTTHVPVAKISESISKELVLQKIETLNRSLISDFGIHRPRIAVLALNPHAGDDGLIGNEEKEVVIPAIEQAQKQKILAFGPYPADGFFGAGQYRKFDAVLAMYHDQGLAPFKSLASTSGVNFTAGLSYIRTSPDHGTGYDIAGKGEADESSLREAIYAAIDIASRRDTHKEITRNPLRKQYVERNKSDNVVLDLSKDDASMHV